MTATGNVVDDPKQQVSKQGTKYYRFRFASDVYTGKGADPETYWFNVMVFSQQLFPIVANLKKGSGVAIIGDYSNHVYQMQKTGEWVVGNDLVARSIYFNRSSDPAAAPQSNQQVAPAPQVPPQAPQPQYQQTQYQPPVPTPAQVSPAPQRRVVMDPPVQSPTMESISDDDLPF